MKFSKKALLCCTAVVYNSCNVSAFVPCNNNNGFRCSSFNSWKKTKARLENNALYVEKNKEDLSAVDEVMAEASDALQGVGWSAPATLDEEMTSDDPFVQRINTEIMEEMGVPLDELLNPATVVNLERDLYNLRTQLAAATGLGDINVGGLSTEECDGGGQGEEIETIRSAIEKKEKKLLIERRSVFRGWLKNVFLVQAILSLVLSFVMASNPAILFGSYDWFYNYQM